MKKDTPEKIGVIGGTFDPIHLGHLIVAEHSAGHLGLDAVIFIPCSLPPHKDGTGLSPAHHRLKMIELAIEGNPRLRVSDIELRRRGVSYSIDTVKELRSLYGRGAALYFIIGADSLVELATWRDYRELFRLCRMVTAGRPGFDLRGWHPAGLFSPDEVGALKRNVMPTPLIGISATEIRRRVREGESITYLVPRPVERYIVENGLYKEDMH